MTAIPVVLDILAAAALLAGGVFAVTAGLGLVRLPDVASRLQAATKPQVLGLSLVCLGVGRVLGGHAGLTLLLVALFQLAVAPVVAQLIGRSAYRSGKERHDRLVVDDLADRRS